MVYPRIVSTDLNGLTCKIVVETDLMREPPDHCAPNEAPDAQDHAGPYPTHWARLVSRPGSLSASSSRDDGIRWMAHQIPQRHEDQIVQVAEEGDGLSKFCKLNRSNPWTQSADIALRPSSVVWNTAFPHFFELTNRVNLVFTREGGAPLPQTSLTVHLTRQLKAAGLPRLRVHDLRHTYACLLESFGTPITTIRYLLGHSDMRTTERYLHALHKRAPVAEQLVQQREAARRLAEALRGTRGGSNVAAT
jgi:hypothetical protein